MKHFSEALRAYFGLCRLCREFLAILGGVLLVKPKIGGAVLITAAAGIALLVQTAVRAHGVLDVILAVIVAISATIGLLSKKRDSSGLELSIVYTGLMLAGNYLAYLAGLIIEATVPLLSLPLFLSLYFLSLWAAWIVAVKITDPLPVANERGLEHDQNTRLEVAVPLRDRARQVG